MSKKNLVFILLLASVLVGSRYVYIYPCARPILYKIGNIDTTISLQRPKIKDYIPQMQQILAATCQIDADAIAIKATTTEKLGFEGREEGLSAYAVVLIYKELQ